MIRPSAAAFFFLLLGVVAAAEEARLTVLATDPAPGTTLHYGEDLYVRYRVESSSPVLVRAEGWSAGRKLPLADSGLSGLPAGGGEDGAFLFSNTHKVPVAMDELRLVATGEDGRKPLAVLRVPLALTWDLERPAVERARPAWVREWSAARTKKIHDGIRSYEARASGGAAGQVLLPGLGLVLTVLVLACAFAPFLAMYFWRGGWRLAALLPALAMAFVAARVIRDTSADPTSHNLWPLEILMTGAPGLLFLAALALARRLRAPSER